MAPKCWGHNLSEYLLRHSGVLCFSDVKDTKTGEQGALGKKTGFFNVYSFADSEITDSQLC